MNRKSALSGLSRAVALGLGLWALEVSLAASEATVTKVSLAERWITNVIEVTIPTNRFVNEYHTNWVSQLRTNLVDVYSTNWIMVTATNPVLVEALWTNVVTSYRTNLITRTRTNSFAVTLVQTNTLNRYHTNWSTLNLTNWVTVVMFRTNWLTQPVTNLVQVNLPARPASGGSAALAAAPAAEAAPGAAKGHWSGPLAILASRTARPAANGLIEVRMNVRYTGKGAAAPKIQSWRIEREDGAVFLFGQEQEFVQELPPGKYAVEARLRAEADGQLLIARGTLSVTATEASVQQRLLASK